jgi:hypothetical protein
MHLVNDQGVTDTNDEFDILDCLNSTPLQEFTPTLKRYIRDHLSEDQRRELKRQLLENNQWVAEYTPGATACLGCNTAVYPMGLGEFVFPCLYF